jgi:hypothetical protein
MELSEDRIRLHDVERNAYDELAIGTTAVLERLEVDSAVVAGYLAILLGRTRATEDVDVIVEPLSADRATALATALREAGYWGSAMPLDEATLERYVTELGVEAAYDRLAG